MWYQLVSVHESSVLYLFHYFSISIIILVINGISKTLKPLLLLKVCLDLPLELTFFGPFPLVVESDCIDYVNAINWVGDDFSELVGFVEEIFSCVRRPMLGRLFGLVP